MINFNQKETDYFRNAINETVNRPISTVENPLEQDVYEAAQRIEILDDIDRRCKEMIGYCIKFHKVDIGEAIEFVGNFLRETVKCVKGFYEVSYISDLYELLGDAFHNYKKTTQTVRDAFGYQLPSLDCRTELMYLGFFSIHEGAGYMDNIETTLSIEPYKIKFRQPLKTHKPNAIEDLTFYTRIV